ncbi:MULTISPECIES: hotdog fold domain-containing protein [Ferrimonas]|uniref:hotdog fold domain-containing protein n=1 Tax=Ferrimonas TaxID=44011 RepID=UPI0003FDEC3E|nr:MULTISPECIES: hotdog fold domain-containing protein [Ferrimonas]USD37019.1 DUF4442 domain-containing protein [Ferrimonas sp. SCSIO 43195]
MSDNYLLKLRKRLGVLPFGDWLLMRVVANKAPYFKTISARLDGLEPNRASCVIPKKRKVENHIGTVHVIAICNGLEIAMGLVAEASIPKHLRWIPKGMSLDYTAKAGSDIRCVAETDADAWQPGNLPVSVTAYDDQGTVVVKGVINLWLSEKPARH